MQPRVRFASSHFPIRFRQTFGTSAGSNLRTKANIRVRFVSSPPRLVTRALDPSTAHASLRVPPKSTDGTSPYGGLRLSYRMASRLSLTTPVSRIPFWVFVVGGWTIYGLVHGLVWAAATKTPFDALRWTVPCALLVAWGWAALTPLIFRLTRAVAPSRVGWAWSLLSHTAAVLVCAALTTLLRRWGLSVFSPWETDLFLPSFLYWFDVWLFVYFTVVVIGRALELRRRYVDRTVRAHLLEAQLVKAQLQYLELQLQPHFLFNSLNAIQELAHESPDAAERMLRRLHSLLALSLDRSGQDEVTLEEELAALEPYLDIQRTRFSDWLEVDIRVPQQLRRALVPHLILQPLVENAIRHGLAVRQGPGRIILSVERIGERLRIHVQDDGVGLRPGPRDPSGRQGIGLRNATERLRQLYGAAHHFELRDARSGGVLVELEIPYQEGESTHPRGGVEPLSDRRLEAPTLDEIASWRTGEFVASTYAEDESPPAASVDLPSPEWQPSGSFRAVPRATFTGAGDARPGPEAKGFRPSGAAGMSSPSAASAPSAVSPSSPALSLRAWLGIVTLWMALAVFWTNQMMLFNSSMETPSDVSIARIARLQIATSVIWLVLSPVVLALAQRFRIDAANWMTRLPLHVAAALASGFLHIWLMRASGLSEVPVLSSVNLNPLTGDFFVYFALLAWSHSRDFVAWYRTRELETALLTSRIAGSRFQALRAQLRPQFLLSTLDLLAELVHHDVPRAERLIARLADTLRLTLDYGRESTTSIKQEVELLFACVEAHRLGIRPGVQLLARMSPETLPIRIPSRLLCAMADDLLVADVANPTAPLTVSVESERVHDATRITLRGETTWPDARTDARTDAREVHAWWRKKSVAEAAVADAGPLVSVTFPDRATAVLMIADEHEKLADEDAAAVPAARSA